MPGTPPPRVGTDFGDYRIEAMLGRGAMGVVYRARQRRLDRPVALKVLPTDLADDPTYRARFAREAAALARLDSPHVVQIYDHGDLDGHLWLAMQLVSGPDLGRVLDDGPLPPRRALRIVGQVATALGDGHAVGVLHRDVKPSNVLMRAPAAHDPDPEGDFAYLCDFGIARGTEGTHETAGVIGTLGYLAPERLNGEAATAAADVYALGCMLWALLVGTPPYSGSQPQVIVAHLQAPVPQLHGDDPRTAAVNALLAGMLAKDPAGRPTIAAVRERLREVLAMTGDEQPVRAVAPPPPDIPRPRRGRRLLLGAVAAVLLLVVGAVVTTWLLDPARSAPDRLRRATPVGASCVATALPDDATRAGAVAQSVCDAGPDVGELRLVALDGAPDTYLREVARQDPQALPAGSCPDGLPARGAWSAGGHSGTVLCYVVGATTRYAWTFDDLGVVAVLDGKAQVPFPRDLAAVAAYVAGARYP